MQQADNFYAAFIPKCFIEKIEIPKSNSSWKSFIPLSTLMRSGVGFNPQYPSVVMKESKFSHTLLFLAIFWDNPEVCSFQSKQMLPSGGKLQMNKVIVLILDLLQAIISIPSVLSILSIHFGVQHEVKRQSCV